MGADVRLPATRGGILPGLLALVAAGAALIALAWMLLLPAAVTTHLRQRTGFDADVQSLMVNPFTGRVVARGFVLGNPPTFPRHEFLQLREFEAEAEILSLFTDRPVIRRLRLDVSLVALVKREDGRTNTQVLQGYLAGRTTAVPPGPRRPFLIRKLELKIDRFMLIDHSRRDPVVRDYLLLLERTFENVADTRQLLLPVSLDELFTLGGAVGNLLPADLTGAIDRALRSGTEVMRELARERPAIFTGFTDALEESKKP
jgi:uncharacterized protein involved in outer membrane biogenesis